MRTLIFMLLTGLTATQQLALAQTYYWKDSQGCTVISDSPPPKNIPAQRVPAQRSTSSSEPTVSTANSDSAAELKKRLAERNAQAGKEREAAQKSAERAEYCQRLSNQLRMLESGQRISMPDQNGERRFLEEDERQREIAKGRQSLQQNCP